MKRIHLMECDEQCDTNQARKIDLLFLAQLETTGTKQIASNYTAYERDGTIELRDRFFFFLLVRHSIKQFTAIQLS